MKNTSQPIQTAVYSRGYDRVTLVWHDVDEVEFVALGVDLSDSELEALVAADGNDTVSGWARESLS